MGLSFLDNALSSGVQSIFGQMSADYQYQLSEQAAENAYNRQLDFWGKQNAYNDPSNVKARLIQAGINPASMTAANSVPAGQLSSVADADAKGYSSPGYQINGMIEGIKSLNEANLIDAETKIKAQELINAQVSEGVEKALRAKGWSEARISELDHRAQWKALYGEDSQVPNNPYWDDDANQHIPDANNPFAQSIRNERAQAEGRELLNQYQYFENLVKEDVTTLFHDFGVDYNNLPADVQTQVGLCMVALRMVNDILTDTAVRGEDNSQYIEQRLKLENRLSSILNAYHSQAKDERTVKGMPSVNQVVAATYNKVSGSDFAHRVATSARDDIHKWYTSALDNLGISH